MTIEIIAGALSIVKSWNSKKSHPYYLSPVEFGGRDAAGF